MLIYKEKFTFYIAKCKFFLQKIKKKLKKKIKITDKNIREYCIFKKYIKKCKTNERLKHKAIINYQMFY